MKDIVLPLVVPYLQNVPIPDQVCNQFNATHTHGHARTHASLNMPTPPHTHLRTHFVPQSGKASTPIGVDIDYKMTNIVLQAFDFGTSAVSFNPLLRGTCVGVLWMLLFAISSAFSSVFFLLPFFLVHFVLSLLSIALACFSLLLCILHLLLFPPPSYILSFHLSAVQASFVSTKCTLTMNWSYHACM